MYYKNGDIYRQAGFQIIKDKLYNVPLKWGHNKEKMMWWPRDLLVDKDLNKIHGPVMHFWRHSDKVVTVKVDFKKYYFIYNDCKRVDHIVYQYISQPFYGMSKVIHDGEWTFANKHGKLIPNQVYFESVKKFIGDVGFVKHNGKWRIINIFGDIVNKLKFDDIRVYNTGESRDFSYLEKVGLKVAIGKVGHLYYHISAQGQILNKNPYKYSSDFKNGLAVVMYKHEDRFRIVDVNNKLIQLTQSFIKYHHILLIYQNYGFINKKGKLYPGLTLAKCEVRNGYINYKYHKNDPWWSIIDFDGHIIHMGNLQKYKYYCSYALVRTRKGYYYIDKSGKRLNENFYQTAEDFCLKYKRAMVTSVRFDRNKKGAMIMRKNRYYLYTNGYHEQIE